MSDDAIIVASVVFFKLVSSFSEGALYGNIILKKGVLPANED